MTEGRIEALYSARTARSAVLAERARSVLPSGIVHDSRHLRPHPVYATHAEGARKWDADGNCYIDYFGGHGALLLGHNPPDVMRAVAEQMARGTHFAACHEAEVAWAEAIVAMVPSAEKVRFHASGSEATQMAVRLARAFTGRDRLMRFHAHYHGWQDDMTAGYASHFNGGTVIGVPEAVAAQTAALDPYNEARVEAALRTGAFAAVILEPLGACTGKIPLSTDFLAQLRNWSRETGTLLIFDEVITGFRVSPGGVQEKTGITPDLTTLAKIVAGGQPGGAVAGRAEILEGLDFEVAERAGRQKIYHPGTFNAAPASAAAGVATLAAIRDGAPNRRAEALAADLRRGLAEVLAARQVAWHVYGEASAFHLCTAPDLAEAPFDPRRLGRAGLQAQPPGLARLLRMAMLVNGIDLSGWPGGLLSAAHTPGDVAVTVAAFDESLGMLKREGML
ncbi:aspartate aminotransferase family protein [Solirhodobacter olei]|uniref:aspartate aminotransferase family protein n=1 Tax=Solirhodobacter olei TaxID=2493082 RepID=UPI000FDA9960|nr:aminotransferase class III-fold pyridoxal phosphate-dependent enzyme [Solirhodobacter olei]